MTLEEMALLYVDHSAAQIAALAGITRSAVLGRLNRAKIKYAGGPRPHRAHQLKPKIKRVWPKRIRVRKPETPAKIAEIVQARKRYKPSALMLKAFGAW